MEAVTGTDRRAAFRDAALQLWADAGWAAVTVPAACGATGYTEADFLAEYDSAEELLTDVFDEGTEERAALVLTAMAGAGSMMDRLRRALGALADHFAADPRQLATAIEAVGCPPLRARRRATNRGYGALISTESGAAHDPVLALAAGQFCIAGFHELVLAWLDPESPVAREHVVEGGARLLEAVVRAH